MYYKISHSYKTQEWNTEHQKISKKVEQELEQLSNSFQNYITLLIEIALQEWQRLTSR